MYMLLLVDKWVPVTKAWRVLRLRAEEQPPIWRVAANILNKQSRTADKGWSSSLGGGCWARCWQLLTVKTGFVTKHERLPQTWIVTSVRPKQRKGDMRFGTWNCLGVCVGQVHIQQQPGN